jgi:hypothetical protein
MLQRVQLWHLFCFLLEIAFLMLVEEWQGLVLNLSDWNQKFLVATTAADNIPASTAAIKIQEEFF